jgi:CRP-like cAMP-binding protein
MVFATSRKEQSMPRSPYQNRILSSLPVAEIGRLTPHLSQVKLDEGRILLDSGQKIRYAYFVEAGLASIVTIMKNGRSVEVSVVGRDGMVGLPALLGTDSLPSRAFIQIPGSGYRIQATQLTKEFERRGKLHEKLQKYIQAHVVQVSQTAACNRLHEISERLARWLLMCQDRTDSPLLQITHKSLAAMLGAPRPTVTLAAGILQKAGLVDYSRARMRILNRKGLERAACECYRTIRKECERLGVM